MTVRIIVGDALEQLRLLPAGSVHCCVTSPPYYGLRDYGMAGQIGLEPTPAEYIAALVEVFREVRRVLRPDGTLWVNIGDTYAAQRGGTNMPAETLATGGDAYRGRGGPFDFEKNRHHNKIAHRDARSIGIKHKDLIGIPWMLAFALRQPWTDWQIQPEAMRAWVAGIVDGEGCITILRTKSSHSESLSFPPVVQVRMCDREPLDRLVEVAGSKIGEPQMPPTAFAANQRESWQWKLVSDKAAKVIAEIYPFLTCKRKQAIVAWNHQAFRAARGNQERKRGDLEKEQFCKDLINDLNQRRAVDIPSWMVEPAVAQEPGWYLRQDLIWAKPNPMPESVTDRCTKAHEYLFMLSRAERYWFDRAAIAEPAQDWSSGGPGEGIAETFHYGAGNGGNGGLANLARRYKTARKTKVPSGWDTEAGAHGTIHREGRTQIAEYRETELLTRNKRSVWTVASQAFPESHFATFPPALIEPAILAGCPRGGTMLDPFAGAGTTGLVADRLGRNAILIELNPLYAGMAERRIWRDGPLFADVAIEAAAD